MKTGKQIIQIPGGGGGGTPGGADTQIQVNNGGAFAGYSNFVWDKVSSLILGDGAGAGENITIKTKDANTAGVGATNLYIQSGSDSTGTYEGYGGGIQLDAGGGINSAGGFQMSGGNSAYGTGGRFELRGGAAQIGGGINLRPGVGTGITNGVQNYALNSQGTGYSVGSILKINGGTEDSIYKVIEVDTGGEILDLTQLIPGQGYSTATGVATTTLSGGGSGATIDVVSIFSGGDGFVTIENPTSAFKATLDTSELSANRTYTFPNNSGTLALTSDITGGSGIIRSISSISTNTSAGSTANTDYVYICTETLTLTLPSAVGNTNRYTIKNTGGTTTIATTSSQTIDGSTTTSLGTLYSSLDIVSNNSNWVII